MLHLFPLAALIFYSTASVAYFRLLGDQRQPVKRARSLLAIGIGFHLIFLGLELFGYYAPGDIEAPLLLTNGAQSFPVALSSVSFGILAVYLFATLRWSLDRIGVFVAPLGAIFMFFSGLVFHLTPETSAARPLNPVLAFHVICWVVSIVFLGCCFVLSVAVIVKESLLKRKKFTALQRNLPSLNALEALEGVFLRVGLIAMLLGLFSGLIYGFDSGITNFAKDPRFMWSLVILAIYGALYLARVRHGWRGTRAAWLNIAGFATLVLSFVGVTLMGGGFHVY